MDNQDVNGNEGSSLMRTHSTSVISVSGSLF